MKIFKIVLLALLIISVSTKVTFAKSGTLTSKQLKRYKPLKVNEGKTLKSLTTAKLSDVHLANPVRYFDIKQYDRGGRYETGWSFDMGSYKKLPVKEKKKIRSVTVQKSNSPFWKIYMLDGPVAGFYNLHYLDTHTKVHTIHSREALLVFLGNIDTPAELTMLFLTESGRVRYKEIDDLYIIRTDLVYEECDGRDEGCYHNIDHIIMDKKGNILMEKTINKPYAEKKCKSLREKFR